MIATKTFTDATGKGWEMVVTLATLDRVRTMTGIDLYAALSGTIDAKVIEDAATITDVLWAAVKPQADREGVTRETFIAAMNDQARADGKWAMLELAADYFPAAHRELLLIAMAKVRKAETALQEAS